MSGGLVHKSSGINVAYTIYNLRVSSSVEERRDVPSGDLVRISEVRGTPTIGLA